MKYSERAMTNFNVSLSILILTVVATSYTSAQNLYPEFVYRKTKDSVAWIRAWERYEAAEFREAIKAIDRLPRSYDDDAAVLRLKALCALQLKEADAALYWLNLALAESPESFGILNDRAEVWNLKENYRAQAADLAGYLHYVTDDTAAVYNYVNAARRIGEYERAIATILDFPFKEAGLYNLLGALYLDAGDCHSAISAMENALKIFPDDGYLLANLAVGHYCVADYQVAIETANRLIAVDPSDGYSYALRGWIYEKMDRMFDARQNFDLAEHYGYDVYEDEEEAYDEEE